MHFLGKYSSLKPHLQYLCWEDDQTPPHLRSFIYNLGLSTNLTTRRESIPQEITEAQQQFYYLPLKMALHSDFINKKVYSQPNAKICLSLQN